MMKMGAVPTQIFAVAILDAIEGGSDMQRISAIGRFRPQADVDTASCAATNPARQ